MNLKDFEDHFALCKCGRLLIHHFNLDGSFKFRSTHEKILHDSYYKPKEVVRDE